MNTKRATIVEDPASLLKTPVPEDATLAERAYYDLRDRIVTLRLRPGSLIREEVVMEELGMSRTPIREALVRLALEKLVVVMSRRGTFVSDVNVGDVGLIYELRRELEATAAGWAAERRSDADVAEIDRLVDELRGIERDAPAVDARAQITLDQSGHYLIYRMAGNPFVADLLRSYYFLSARIWFLASGRVTMEEPFGGLISVLESIKQRDADAARRFARLHSVSAESAIRAAL